MNEKTSENKENQQYVFQFECSEKWENLTETEDEKIRHCRLCSKNVHLVQNDNEFNSNAEKGNCIYYAALRTAGIVAPVEGSEEFLVEPIKAKPKLLPEIFRFTVLFFLMFPLVSFLPLFVQKTMTRSQTSGGDIIDYDWQVRTFYGFLSASKYPQPEENFAFYFLLNFALACFYSLTAAYFVNLIFKKFRRKIKR